MILAVALLDPGKTIPGTDWHPWLYLREIVAIGPGRPVARAWARDIRRAEPLQLRRDHRGGRPVHRHLHLHAAGAANPQRPRRRSWGSTSPGNFFWATGILSSVLDNAPTYVVFFETAKSLHREPGSHGRWPASQRRLLVAISLGAVFMGAMTYIGNGPNFMVKAIAEKSGVKMPSFFGYMATVA